LSLGEDYQTSTDNEAVWDNHAKEFSALISLATSIIESANDSTSTDAEVRLSMETCVVAPLYFMATRCRHRILRRKAIELMRLSPRLEGLCDSRLLAKIAERVVDIEEGQGRAQCERHSPSISDVAVTFDPDERRAFVTYLCQRGELRGKIQDQKDSIAW
jgi:hypothetical protein